MTRNRWLESVMAGVMLWSLAACVNGPRLATSFTATLAGANETPPVSTSATGQATFEFVGSSIRYVITITNLSGSAAASHIHIAPVGSPGPIGMNLCGTSDTPACASGASVTLQGGSTPVNLVGFTTLDVVLEAMRDSGAYVNVHTAANPNGEIRGLILPAQ